MKVLIKVDQLKDRKGRPACQTSSNGKKCDYLLLQTCRKLHEKLEVVDKLLRPAHNCPVWKKPLSKADLEARAEAAYRYAKDVVKGAWPAGEEDIKKSNKYRWYYHRLLFYIPPNKR